MSTEIDSDQNGPGIQIFSDAMSDDDLVKQGITVHSTDAWLRAMAHDLTVGGTLQATNYGANLGDTAGEVASNKLSVGLLGEVQGGVIAAVVRGSGTVSNNGAGTDRLFGGPNKKADRLVLSAVTDSGRGIHRDAVMRFERGIDDMILREIDAKARTASIHEAVASAHSVRRSEASRGAVVRGRVDGNRIAGFEILPKGLTGLGQAHVLL